MSSAGVDTYTLKMLDQITAPLRKIEAQMERMVGVGDRLAGSVDKLGGMLGKVGKAGAIAGLALGGIGLAVKAVTSVMEVGYSVGSRFVGVLLDVAKFRAQNISALSVFLGKGKGEGVMNRALDIGGMTPADELDVVKQVRELASAGFKGAGLDRANAALLDVQSMLGQEEADNLRYYLRKFIGGRKVEADDLRMAAFSSGQGEMDVIKRVLGNRGLSTTGSNAALGKVFDQLKKDGKVTGQDVIQALFQGINEKLSEGKGLGAAAKSRGMGTLEGLLSNLMAAPRKFLLQMKLEDMPGLKVLMDFIKRLLPFFEHGTVQGKKLAAVVEQIANALFGGLSKITDKDLARIFDAAIVVAQRFAVLVREIWDLLDKMLHGSWTELIKASGSLLIEVGKFIGIGIYQGIRAAMFGYESKASPRAAPVIHGIDRAAAGRALGDIPSALGKVGSGLYSAGGKVAGGVGTAFGDLGGAFGKVGRDLGIALGIVDKPKAGGAAASIAPIIFNGGITVTVPPGTQEEQAQSFASQMAEEVRRSRQRLSPLAPEGG